MKFKVIKEFRDPSGAVRILGEVVEIDHDRAAILRRHGLIGTFDLGVEKAKTISSETSVAAPLETADNPPTETGETYGTKRRGRPKRQD